MLRSNILRVCWFRALLALGLMGMAGGCTMNQGPVAALIDKVTPASPREVAADAFDVDPDVRRTSVAQLSASPFGGEEPYLRLYRLLVTDPDDTVRAACVKALGSHGTAEDADRILARLDDKAEMVRWEAAQALQKIHHDKAVDPLMKTLIDDEDADVRQAAALALGQYPERAVFNALVQALEDPQFVVAAAARQSLGTLTGYDFGTDISLWLTYAEEHPETMFEQQRRYTWVPFDKPPTFMDRVKFWEPDVKPTPRPPAGYVDGEAASEDEGEPVDG